MKTKDLYRAINKSLDINDLQAREIFLAGGRKLSRSMVSGYWRISDDPRSRELSDSDFKLYLRSLLKSVTPEVANEIKLLLRWYDDGEKRMQFWVDFAMDKRGIDIRRET